MRLDQFNRWILLLSDMAILVAIIVIAYLFFHIDMGRRVDVIMFMATASSWFFAYRTNELKLDYYTSIIKIFIWASLFSIGYLVFMMFFRYIPIVLSFMLIWVFCAALLRFALNRFNPKITILAFNRVPYVLPKHGKIVYLHKEDLTDLSLNKIDAVLIDGNLQYSEDWRKFVMHAQAIGLPTITINQLREYLSGKVSLEELNQTWINTSFSVSWEYKICKYIGDFVITLCFLPIWLPIFILVSLAIFITMGWPVIFIQQRIGKSGKLFKIYKFRTMRICDTVSETLQDDQRITKLGKFLRKFRLDEIPQFINILKGEMSLIGPRPEWELTAEQFSKEIPAYNIRHLVRPGITGWAQVNQGHAIGISENYTKLQYDIYYVKHFSFWIDIRIALKTLQTLLTGKGAK